MPGNRARIPHEVETSLLVKSRRRCCLCFFLDGDLSQKQVQIAHISRDRTDSREENLVVLCLNHHDQYDSSTSQSKGLTSGEVRHYKKRLEDFIERWERAPHQLAVPHPLIRDLAAGESGAEFLQLPPLSSSMQLRQDIDALPLLMRLSDPSEAKQVRSILVENDLLSPDLDPVETVILKSELKDSAGRSYCTVLIGSASSWVWDVLLLRNRGGKWRRIGRIPLPGQKGYTPVLKYISGKTTSVLTVEYVAGYGSGVFRKITTWYRIGPEGLVPILSFPIQAYVVGWGMPFQRHIKGDVLEAPHFLEGGSRLEISLSAEYSADPSWLYNHQISEDLPLFSFVAKLILEWDEDARIFLPSKGSTATFEQAEGLFNDDSNSFLSRFEDEIIDLIKNRGTLVREWVRDLIDHTLPSAHRSRIETALDEKFPNRGR